MRNAYQYKDYPMAATGTQYDTFHRDELEYFERRDIRPSAVEELKERIAANGYNPARPMRVVKENGSLLVADGNHRLRAVEELELDDPIPCHVDPDGDPVSIGVQANRDEDVYAEEDLFDTLDTIDYLRAEEELTQAEIGERIGWSRSKTSQYTTLLANVATPVLELARGHQEGRVADDATAVANFTEYWFRTTGLYDLDAEWQAAGEDEPKHAQLRFMEWFCEEQNCDVAKSQVERQVAELKRVADQLDTFDAGISEAVDDDKHESKRQEIIRGELSDSQVEDAIESLNQGAKDQYHFGADALDVLRDLPDNEVDIVVTDPPYGVNFESRRETDNPDYDTDKEPVLEYLSDVFAELERVCKANSHIYVFFPIDYICDIKALATEHFRVDETPLIWVKNNHGPMTGGKSFKEMHAHRYETIFLFRMDNGYERKLNANVSPNVLEYPVPKGDDRWHDSQKPRELLKDIITNCTGSEEVVLDPFAGSGSTLLAAAESDRHFIGIEQDDSYESRFKRELGKVKK